MTREEMTFSELMDHLLFRRQFLLGPEPFAPTPAWTCRPLRHGLVLSTHPDLLAYSGSSGSSSVTFLGFAIDALHPGRSEQEIVDLLASNAPDIGTLASLTKPLAGRWVIIYQDQAGTRLFTDPCGFRLVYYYSDGRHVWCGSQPEIIKANCRLSWNTDERLLEYLLSSSFAKEGAWAGAQTMYEGCMHLMPNHYLDVNRSEQIRFYPVQPITIKDTSSVIDVAKKVLRGIFAGIVGQQSVRMALTSGWDSRLLLAASREVSGKMQYWIDRMDALPMDHPDIRIPSILAKRLGINFQVKNSSQRVPGWFTSAMSRNVTGARVLPVTRSLFAELATGEQRLNIGGDAGEVCRVDYDMHCRLDPKTIRTSDIPPAFTMASFPFVTQEIEKWRKGLPDLDDRLNTLTLYQWEQRFGNWGAQNLAEQDIGTDELSPFNCRLWIETLLSVPRRLRALPDYPLYRELIESMWPEVLSVPFHHGPMVPRVVTVSVDALKRRVRVHVSDRVAETVKSLASRFGRGRRRP